MDGIAQQFRRILDPSPILQEGGKQGQENEAQGNRQSDPRHLHRETQTIARSPKLRKSKFARSHDRANRE